MSRYSKLRLLSRTTCSTTYLVEDRLNHGKFFELKILKLTDTDDDCQNFENTSTRILNILLRLTQIKHPFICYYHQAFIQDGIIHIITEHNVPGAIKHSTDESFFPDKHACEAIVLKCIAGLCLALIYLEEHNIILTRLPYNSLAFSGSSPDMQVKLCDVELLSKIVTPSSSLSLMRMCQGEVMRDIANAAIEILKCSTIFSQDHNKLNAISNANQNGRPPLTGGPRRSEPVLPSARISTSVATLLKMMMNAGRNKAYETILLSAPIGNVVLRQIFSECPNLMKFHPKLFQLVYSGSVSCRQLSGISSNYVTNRTPFNSTGHEIDSDLGNNDILIASTPSYPRTLSLSADEISLSEYDNSKQSTNSTPAFGSGSTSRSQEEWKRISSASTQSTDTLTRHPLPPVATPLIETEGQNFFDPRVNDTASTGLLRRCNNKTVPHLAPRSQTPTSYTFGRMQRSVKPLYQQKADSDCSPRSTRHFSRSPSPTSSSNYGVSFPNNRRIRLPPTPDVSSVNRPTVASLSRQLAVSRERNNEWEGRLRMPAGRFPPKHNSSSRGKVKLVNSKKTLTTPFEETSFFPQPPLPPSSTYSSLSSDRYSKSMPGNSMMSSNNSGCASTDNDTMGLLDGIPPCHQNLRCWSYPPPQNQHYPRCPLPVPSSEDMMQQQSELAPTIAISQPITQATISKKTHCSRSPSRKSHLGNAFKQCSRNDEQSHNLSEERNSESYLPKQKNNNYRQTSTLLPSFSDEDHTDVPLNYGRNNVPLDATDDIANTWEFPSSLTSSRKVCFAPSSEDSSYHNKIQLLPHQGTVDRKISSSSCRFSGGKDSCTSQPPISVDNYNVNDNTHDWDNRQQFNKNINTPNFSAYGESQPIEMFSGAIMDEHIQSHRSKLNFENKHRQSYAASSLLLT